MFFIEYWIFGACFVAVNIWIDNPDCLRCLDFTGPHVVGVIRLGLGRSYGAGAILPTLLRSRWVEVCEAACSPSAVWTSFLWVLYSVLRPLPVVAGCRWESEAAIALSYAAIFSAGWTHPLMLYMSWWTIVMGPAWSTLRVLVIVCDLLVKTTQCRTAQKNKWIVMDVYAHWMKQAQNVIGIVLSVTLTIIHKHCLYHKRGKRGERALIDSMLRVDWLCL